MISFRRGDEKSYRTYVDQMRPLDQRVLHQQKVKSLSCISVVFSLYDLRRTLRRSDVLSSEIRHEWFGVCSLVRSPGLLWV